MKNAKKFPQRTFDYIERYVPFSSVDIIISFNEQDGRRIILTKRAIRPYSGWWQLPGSIVLKNEPMTETVKRSAHEELGIDIHPNPLFLGNYELFTNRRHYITHLYMVDFKSGNVTLDTQSSNYVLTKPDRLPARTIPIQRRMIKDAIKRNLL